MAAFAKFGGWAYTRCGIFGVHDEEGSVLGTEEASSVKCFDSGAFGSDFEILSDSDERGNFRALGAKSLRYD